MDPTQQQETVDPTIKALVQAIGKTESGGLKDPYNARGGSGEYGAYQFMPKTWQSWAKRYLGDGNAPMTMENQNKVAYSQVKYLKEQGYNPAQIASIWNSGGPSWEGKVGTNKYGVHYDTPSYVRKVSQYYSQFRGEDVANQQQTGTESGPVNTPSGKLYPVKVGENPSAPLVGPPKPKDIFDDFEQSPVGKVVHAAGSLTDAVSEASAKVAHMNINPLSLFFESAPEISAADIAGTATGALGGVIGSGVYGVGQIATNAFDPNRGLFQGVLDASAEGGKKGEEFGRSIGEQGAEAAPMALASEGASLAAIKAPGVLGTAGKVAGTGIDWTNKAMNASMGYEGMKALNRGDYEKATQFLAPLFAGEIYDAASTRLMPEFHNSKDPDGGTKAYEDPAFRLGVTDGLKDAQKGQTAPNKLITKARQFYGDALNIREGDTKSFLKKNRNIDQTLDDLREMGIFVDKNPETNQIDTSRGLDQIQTRLDTQMKIVNDAVKSDTRARIQLDDWRKNALEQIDDMSSRSKSEKLEMKDYLESVFMDFKRAYPEGNITPQDLLLERRQLGNRQIKWDANPREKLQNTVDKQLYHAGNDTLYNTFKNTEFEGAIQKSNEITSRLMDAKTLLDRANGRIVKGGRLGWMWRRTMGYLLGHTVGGPIGGIAAEVAAGKIGDYVNDPAWATKRAIRITKKLNSGMGFLDRSTAELVKDLMNKRYAPSEIAKRPKALPPGKVVNQSTGQFEAPTATIEGVSPEVASGRRDMGLSPYGEKTGPVSTKEIIAARIREKNGPKKELVEKSAQKVTEPEKPYAEDVRAIAEQVKAKSSEVKKVYSKDNRVADNAGKRAKGVGLQESAILRKLREEPTPKELETAIKYLNSNYVGKTVLVDGAPATVKGSHFGKVKVEFPDGELRTVDKASIESKEVTKEEAIAHLKEQAKKQALALLGTSEVPVDNGNVVETTPVQENVTEQVSQ